MPFTLPEPTDKEREALARLFASIASEAGVRVMDVYNSDFEHRTKADYSPVSDADERAEEVILARLEEALPGVPVLAEERASRDGVGENAWDAFLLVDPVDGTREFINRRGDFTVNIALICHGLPIAGAVYAPARKEMYFGGAHAQLIEDFTPGAKLREGRTLHHDVTGHFGAGRVVLRAADPGTGIIAGGPVRAIFEALGVNDVVAKSVGTSNPHNMIRAAFDALNHCSSPRSVASRRGKKVSDVIGRKDAAAEARE